MKLVGYGCRSTVEQAQGVSIEVQRRAVECAAESNGWDLTWRLSQSPSSARDDAGEQYGI